MQPSPTASLRSASSLRLRAWTTTFHAALLVALLSLGACRDPKVTTYRVPKEAAAPAQDEHAGHAHGPEGADHAPSGAMDQSSGVTTASGQSLAWTAPAHWESRQGSSMRKATYAVTGEGGAAADLAVTAFPGDVGGEIANVNRWRGQLGLAPVSDAEATAAIERVDANGLKIGMVDIVDRSAENPAHMLGAWVPYDGATWFFKLVGPDAVVAKEKAAFVEFIKTIKPAAATTP